jgi:hypothetical protein
VGQAALCVLGLPLQRPPHFRLRRLLTQFGAADSVVTADLWYEARSLLAPVQHFCTGQHIDLPEASVDAARCALASLLAFDTAVIRGGPYDSLAFRRASLSLEAALYFRHDGGLRRALCDALLHSPAAIVQSALERIETTLRFELRGLAVEEQAHDEWVAGFDGTRIIGLRGLLIRLVTDLLRDVDHASAPFPSLGSDASMLVSGELVDGQYVLRFENCLDTEHADAARSAPSWWGVMTLARACGGSAEQDITDGVIRRRVLLPAWRST